MSTLAYILLLVITLATGLFPLLKKMFDQLNTNISQKQFDLLRKLVEEAVSYVNQTALLKDLSSIEKKDLAITAAENLANTFGIPKGRQGSICDLIESILWVEDAPDIDTDTDTDDDFDD